MTTEYTPELHAQLRELCTYIPSQEADNSGTAKNYTDPNGKPIITGLTELMYPQDSLLSPHAREAVSCLLDEIDRLNKERHKITVRTWIKAWQRGWDDARLAAAESKKTPHKETK